MVFYRQYRPQTLDELIGQDHVKSILKKAHQENRLSHAYLFCGPRGTGKTSTARILAKMVNCQIPE
ncbi:MAG: polymerase III, subunit gamma and tau protein, partial [Candidatus Daviesbacteria bacterium GW2011_GWA1_38_7]